MGRNVLTHCRPRGTSCVSNFWTWFKSELSAEQCGGKGGKEALGFCSVDAHQAPTLHASKASGPDLSASFSSVPPAPRCRAKREPPMSPGSLPRRVALRDAGQRGRQAGMLRGRLRAARQRVPRYRRRSAAGCTPQQRGDARPQSLPRGGCGDSSAAAGRLRRLLRLPRRGCGWQSPATGGHPGAGEGRGGWQRPGPGSIGRGARGLVRDRGGGAGAGRGGRGAAGAGAAAKVTAGAERPRAGRVFNLGGGRRTAVRGGRAAARSGAARHRAAPSGTERSGAEPS